MNHLNGLHARVAAALLEISHLRAMATHPATLEELADVERSLNEVAALLDDRAGDSAEHIDSALRGARHRLHAIHNALASSGRAALVPPRGRADS